MKLPPRTLLCSGAIALLLLGLVILPAPAPAADHAESPALALANAGTVGGRDINDIYIFQSPQNSSNTVLILTTNPFAGTDSPVLFDPNVDYEFKIDNNGDAREDITIRFRFTADQGGGVQNFTVTTLARRGTIRRLRGNSQTGANFQVNGATIRCALQDDPFFFDAVGFGTLLNTGGGFPRAQGTAQNFFGPVVGGPANTGPNVLAITIELPSVQLQNGSNTNIGLWAITKFNGRQADRMGRPAINSALIPRGNTILNIRGRDLRDRFNQTPPSRDAMFRRDMATIISNIYGNPANANALANILLPDILTFNTSNANGFLNGRRLEDDVIDAELGLLTNGGITTDNVGNDSTFLNTFPYIGAPNATPQGPNTN